ncbi:MAG TPA: vitamin K epoxide reductase family protein [Anaerolineales bacterium]|nr:vitamin K epoxide reductase family protein [Anaerolineales bacterium]
MDKWLYRISIALTLLGLAVSVYMTVFKLTDNARMCLGNGGCSKVNSSAYAEVYGIPVAAIGIGGYAVIAALLMTEKRSEFFQQNGTMLVFGLALIGFLFTLYLIYVELALIHALCPFCVTSQITMTILFIFSIVRLARQPIN